ncbi:MAG: ABC transporter ATP-binding protein [Patescibacteria group bacterium]
MSEDADVKRRPPVTIWQYLLDMRETARLVKWVWDEKQTPVTKKYFRRFMVLEIFTILFSTMAPYAVSYIFDGIQNRNAILALQGFAAFAFCYTVNILFMWLHFRSREYLLGEHMVNWDQSILKRMFQKSAGQHIQHASELGVSNIDKGRWKASEMETTLLFDGYAVFLNLALAWFLLFMLSGVAGLLATGMLAMHFLWSLFLNRRTIEACLPIDKEFRRINKFFTERIDKYERVAVNAKQKPEIKVHRKDSSALLVRDRWFWLWYIGQISSRSLITNIFTIVIMGYGVWNVWQGNWNMGLLFPLFAWVQKLADNMWRVSEIERHFNFNMPSVKSLSEALKIEPDVVEKSDAKDLNGAKEFCVEFSQISHTYPGQEPDEDDDEETDDVKKDPRPVLRNVGFTIEPGEKVALLGVSGSGKTTLMRLLLRHMDPQYGSISVNGYDLRDVKLASWLKHVGYIAQHPQIFNNTLRYNLLYSLSEEERARITDDEIWELMRRYKIDFEDRLTHGLETKVGKDGLQLSGGEKQRVMIGAAMIKNPDFLVIDEATSNLDSLTEWEVQQGLELALAGDQGALVIAHRLSTVRRICDKFIVLKPANKLQNGEPQIEAVAYSFAELYELSPTFRALADKQELRI